MSAQEKASFLDKFTMVAARIGNQVHLRSLRDAFATMMPLYILAGIAVLVNNVVFPLFLSGDALSNVQVWGTALTNGTLNVASIVICGLIGYCLAANRRFDNPLACVVVSLSALLAMMPFNVSASLADASGDAVEVASALIYGNVGVNGLFAGIIIGLVATEVFVRLSGVERLKVNLGEGVPPAVSNSFNVLIPMLLTLSVFGIVTAVLKVAFGTDLIALIKLFVQEPLKALGTSLPAVVLIYSIGNFLFTLGIHQTVVNGVLLEPVLTVAISENMQAAAAGQAIPNNITINTLNCFGMMGGHGLHHRAHHRDLPLLQEEQGEHHDRVHVAAARPVQHQRAHHLRIPHRVQHPDDDPVRALPGDQHRHHLLRDGAEPHRPEYRPGALDHAARALGLPRDGRRHPRLDPPGRAARPQRHHLPAVHEDS